MVKEIAMILALLTAPTVAGGSETASSEQLIKPMVHPPRAEINYRVDGEQTTYPLQKRDDGIMILPELDEKTTAFSADEIFEKRKNALNERYDEMFTLKEEMEKHRRESREFMYKHRQKADEMHEKYHALLDNYQKEMASIVGEWAREKALNG